MWTPRRIVLLALGLLLAISGYLGYTLSVLGGIDGLPTLPLDLRRSESPVDPGPPPVRVYRRVEDRLRQAFGGDAPELKWPIQLELNNRTLVVAASDFKLEPDGRISLIRVAVASFARDRVVGTVPEINTLRGEMAYLKFDRPVSNLSEVSGRKIVGGEITGNIQITSNRRTADRGDDLVMHIGTGPLYYSEPKHLIWTHDTVHILDHSSKPKPMQIWGKGLEVELVAEAAPASAPRPGARRPTSDRISGISRAQLQSNVDMTFYVDAATGFPSGKRDQPKPPPGTPSDAPPAKAQLTIKTSGKFRYEFGKEFDTVRFEVPVPDNPQPERIQQFVIVERFHDLLAGQKDVRDQLYCARLELHLRKNSATMPGETRKPEPTGKNIASDRGTDILFARAQGPMVTMTSDAENLEATGTDLIYDARQSRTILRGEPRMTASRDRHRLTGREIQITEHPATSPGKKGHQTVVVLGPGRFDVYDDKQPEKITAQAFWNDRLSTSREGEFELLVLTGAARFVDRVGEQTLQGETLKVWTTSGEALADKQVTVSPSATGGGRRVQVIEALGNVGTASRELNIHDTSRLIVRFRDAPEGQLPNMPAAVPGRAPTGEKILPKPDNQPGPVRTITPPPGPVPAPRLETALKPVLADQPSTPARGSSPGPAPGLVVGGNNPNPRKSNEPPRPLHMSARNVEAWVIRIGPKNQLERVWTEGSVHVKQAPAKPEEKGLDILGDTLAMDCHPEGNVLEVTGDLAQLRMDRLYILGPVVNIDQPRNMAWVNGAGAMQMESQTNFAGDKLARPVPMIIQWRKSMVFNGSHAEFHQSIQAEQDSALMVCDTLQVFFDRHIEMKQGPRADQPARVKTMVCDRNVRIEERVAQGDRILKYQRIETNETLRMDALEAEVGEVRNEVKPADGNEVRAGAGTLRLFQIGGPDPLANAGKAPPGKKDPEPKLTFIQYSKSLYVNSKLNKAVFFGQVRVLNMPTKDPLREIKLEDVIADLPADALYLTCDRMTVLNRGDKARSQQEMLAQGRVSVKAKEFWGQADTVTFNEAKDQIILDGGPDGEATLYKEVAKGVPPQKITGKKITYIRSTGDFKLDEGRGLLGQ